MSTLSLQTVTFHIDEQSQKSEWSDHEDVQLPGVLQHDENGNPIVDVALRSFDLEFSEEHFLTREYVYLDVSTGQGHNSCRVTAKARLHTINPEANWGIKFKGRIEALVIAEIVSQGSRQK